MHTNLAALYIIVAAVQALSGAWTIEGVSSLAMVAVITVVRVSFVAGVGVDVSNGRQKRAKVWL